MFPWIRLLSGICGLAAIAGSPATAARVYLPDNAPAALHRAAAITASRLSEALDAKVPIQSLPRMQGCRLAISFGDTKASAIAVAAATLTPPTDPEGFHLRIDPKQSFAGIAAGSPLGCLHGAGRLLASLRWQNGKAALPALDLHTTPALPLRSVYFAIHFNNWYENCSDAQLVRLLEDLGLYGVNAVWTWYNFERYANPFDPATAGAEAGKLARAAWEKQQKLLRAAHALGMRCGYLTCSNLLYVDQAAAHPEWQAKPHGSGGITPRHACPSIPEARALLLKNHEEIIRRRAYVDMFVDWPYDWGGCGCARCQPYLHTYLGLAREKVEILHRYWPKAQAWLSDWHFSDDEATEFSRWSRTPAADWVQGLMKDDRHPWDRFTARGLRPDVRQAAFLDLTMIGAWGVMGANPFPKRLGRIAAALPRNGQRGVIGYTEGIYDEANKYLMARLAWDPATAPQAALEEYAALRFGPAARPVAALLALQGEQWENEMASWSGARFRFDRELATREEALCREAEAALAKHPRLRQSDAFQMIALRARLDTLACALTPPAESVRRSLASLPAAATPAAQREALHAAETELAQTTATLAAMQDAEARLRHIYHSECWLPENVLSLDSWLKLGMEHWPAEIARLQALLKTTAAAPDAELPAHRQELMLAVSLQGGASASSSAGADTDPGKAVDGKGYTLFEGAWTGKQETFWCAARGQEQNAWWMAPIPDGQLHAVTIFFRNRHWDGSNTYFALPRKLVLEISDDGAAWRAAGETISLPEEGTPYQGPLTISCAARGKWLRLRFPEGAQRQYLELVEVSIK